MFARNCLQFEPDHPTYIRTCLLVYHHINEHKQFQCLDSTRHYGPMVFTLAWNKNLDELLSHLIWNDRLDDAVACVRVFYKIHDDSKLSDMDEMSSEEIVRAFAKQESSKPGKVNMALDKLMEEKQREQSILSGHGAK